MSAWPNQSWANQAWPNQQQAQSSFTQAVHNVDAYIYHFFNAVIGGISSVSTRVGGSVFSSVKVGRSVPVSIKVGGKQIVE